MSNKDYSNKFLLTLFGMQKAKSTAQILLIILFHVAGWCLLFFLPLLLYPVRYNNYRFIPELIDKSLLVLLFYFNYYYLIPRFFEKKKYLSYFLLTFLVFTIHLSQHTLIRANFRMQSNDPSIQALPEKSIIFGISKRVLLVSMNNAASSFSLFFLLGGFIRLAFSFLQNQNEKKLLENANLNAEVNLLKSQINPHFLFNTLNSIYAQAHSRSDKTEISVLKLSELLRYMIYDSRESKVPLAKDIQYINNYIDLQKIRLSSKVKIDYTVTGKMEGYTIAPLLLITFVENAFKHGISYSNSSCINIEIKIIDETLTLFVRNPFVQTDTFTDGGIGLKNVSRRLELLYPGKYQLSIQRENDQHVVNLNLDLKSDKLFIN